MDDKLRRIILEHFDRFGKAKFRHYDYSNPKQIRYAEIEILAEERTADMLVGEFNRQLTQDNGVRAYARLIPLGIQQGEKEKYVIEIVPHDYVQHHERAEATEEYLRRMPHVLKNLEVKKGKKDLRRGKWPHNSKKKSTSK